jgi:hypothetical protein
MVHARLVALAFAATLAACGSAPPASTPAPVPGVAPSVSASPSAGGFPNDLERMKRFHSKRFGVVVPFPDGKAWRIDDHSKDQLVATHAATSSTVTIALVGDDDLMNRQKCEAKARAMSLVPKVDLRTVEDYVTVAMQDYDTRVWVAIEPPPDPTKKLVGHVFAFGGYLRKCLFFHYASEVTSSKGEDALSSRLAFAKTRMLGEMKADAFDEVPKDKGPGIGR